MVRRDLELEKVRLISLALDLGFDEQSANRCLDRLISLYGDDGKEFVTVECCGDDYLAALAASMEESGDWDDDLRAVESEACGTLNEMFDKDNNTAREPNGDNKARDSNPSDYFINLSDDSPQKARRPDFMELDSSTSDSDDDLDFCVSG